MPKQNTPVVVYAREQWLDTPTLASDSNISLHVYRSPDHTLNEMLNEWYFSTLMHRLRPGDFIRIRDAEGNHSEVIVDEIIKDRRHVLLSIYHVLNVVPVADALAGDKCSVRWRGKSGFAVMRGSDVIVQNLATREEAETALRYMRRSNNYSKDAVRTAQILEEQERMNPTPRGRGREPEPVKEFDHWENAIKEAPVIRPPKQPEAAEQEAEEAPAPGNAP
jgi:nitroreductase